MTRVHLALVVLVLAVAALVGELNGDYLVWGSLDDSIIWGN